jgi:hypothetical protein
MDAWRPHVLEQRLLTSRLVHNGVEAEGHSPEDAPDPRVEQAERLKLMPIPIMGLGSQPSLEDTDSVGLEHGQDALGYHRHRHRDRSERTSTRSVLLDHVNYILLNQYRQELGRGGNPWDNKHKPTVTDLTINGRVAVFVDGLEMPAVEVGTNPFVYGIGTELPDGGIVTAVLPRAQMNLIQIQFTTRRYAP